MESEEQLKELLQEMQQETESVRGDEFGLFDWLKSELLRGQIRIEGASQSPIRDALQNWHINNSIDSKNVLTEFRVDSVTEGIDAIGDVTIRIEKDGNIFVGRGSDTDIIVASAKAYMNALNRAVSSDEKFQD